MNEAYILNWDFNRDEDVENDAFHIPFVGDTEFGANLIRNEDFSHPSLIYFRANFSALNRFDYLVTDLHVPVMSNKMIATLLAGTNIGYKLIPTAMIDDTYLNEICDSENNLLPNIPVINSYSILHLSEYLDAFDYNNSEYKTSAAIPGMIRVRKLILRNSEFPKIFRIRESAGKLFISGEAKKELESKKIRGCFFEKVEVI